MSFSRWNWYTFFVNVFNKVEIELHVIELMQVKMISWKIYMIMEFYFYIVGFKEQMKYINIPTLC
jgi:hypothetical protein